MTETHVIESDTGVVREFEVKPPKNSALICLPAVHLPGTRWGDWHCTMAYIRDVNGPFFEETGVEEITKQQLLDVLRDDERSGRMYQHDRFQVATVYNVAVFDGEVPVLEIGIEPTRGYGRIVTQLSELHMGVTETLRAADIRYETDYVGPYSFKPHVSVDLRTAIKPPKELLLTPMELWYKNDEPVVV